MSLSYILFKLPTNDVSPSLHFAIYHLKCLFVEKLLFIFYYIIEESTLLNQYSKFSTIWANLTFLVHFHLHFSYAHSPATSLSVVPTHFCVFTCSSDWKDLFPMSVHQGSLCDHFIRAFYFFNVKKISFSYLPWYILSWIKSHFSLFTTTKKNQMCSLCPQSPISLHTFPFEPIWISFHFYCYTKTNSCQGQQRPPCCCI